MISPPGRPLPPPAHWYSYRRLRTCMNCNGIQWRNIIYSHSEILQESCTSGGQGLWSGDGGMSAVTEREREKESHDQLTWSLSPFVLRLYTVNILTKVSFVSIEGRTREYDFGFKSFSRFLTNMWELVVTHTECSAPPDTHTHTHPWFLGA